MTIAKGSANTIHNLRTDMRVIPGTSSKKSKKKKKPTPPIAIQKEISFSKTRPRANNVEMGGEKFEIVIIRTAVIKLEKSF